MQHYTMINLVHRFLLFQINVSALYSIVNPYVMMQSKEEKKSKKRKKKEKRIFESRKEKRIRIIFSCNFKIRMTYQTRKEKNAYKSFGSMFQVYIYLICLIISYKHKHYIDIYLIFFHF